MFNPKLQVGQILSNQELYRLFGCGTSGGMRRSNKTDTLVLISDITKGVYDDRWAGDTLHYTGMGLRGDQNMKGTQNITLAESDANGVGLHLFEVTVPKEYVYQGMTKLVGKPYQEIQPDADNKPRKVWVFPLEVKQESIQKPIVEDLRRQQERKESEANTLSTADILDRLSRPRGKNIPRLVNTNQHDRDPHVSTLVKRLANGRCHYCKEEAPFTNRKGLPYLEVHHIVWLSRGGEDSIDNTVALCPNCHRKMHILDRSSDVALLERVTARYEAQISLLLSPES